MCNVIAPCQVLIGERGCGRAMVEVCIVDRTLIEGSICAGIEFRTLTTKSYHLMLLVWYQSSRVVELAYVSDELFRVHGLLKTWRIYIYI